MIDFTNPSDTLLVGILIGLTLSLVISIVMVKVNIFTLQKEQIAYQQQLDAEFEQKRLEAEGWVVN